MHYQIIHENKIQLQFSAIAIELGIQYIVYVDFVNIKTRLMVERFYLNGVLNVKRNINELVIAIRYDTDLRTTSEEKKASATTFSFRKIRIVADTFL